MPENFNFIKGDGVELYVRRIRPTVPSKKALLLLNSRSLCVESTAGISMGSISYGDYTASKGIETFLVDLRGYGMSSAVPEQQYETFKEVTNPTTCEEYISDIKSAVTYIKSQIGDDVEISMMGFSFIATIAVLYADRYPDDFKNIIVLNPSWVDHPNDPERGFNFYTPTKGLPYTKVSISSIEDRLAQAQPAGKDFREPLWSSEANSALRKYHKTFNEKTEDWKLVKNVRMIEMINERKNTALTNIKANLLFISAQYDCENPLFIVNRIMNLIPKQNKYLKILPNATHLCIWEKQRQTLYEWTVEFIL